MCPCTTLPTPQHQSVPTGQRLLDTPAEKAHRLLEAAAASQQPAPRAANGTDAPTATATLLPTREQAAKVDRVLASTLAQVCGKITTFCFLLFFRKPNA